MLDSITDLNPSHGETHPHCSTCSCASGAAPDACSRVDQLEAQLAHAQAQLSEAETLLSDAINLCVVLERLHGSIDHGEVLRAIQDVVINLVGSEELCIYEPGAQGGWVPAQSFGVGGARLAPVPDGQGPVGRAGAEGELWLTAGDGPHPGDPDLTACVPLVAEGRAVAVLAVWRLLPHKPALRRADRHVLSLLGPHAGRALLLTSRRTGRARAA